MQNQNSHGLPSPSRQQDQDDSGGYETRRGSGYSSLSAGDTVIVPTKTHDGGGMDIPTNPNANGEGEGQQQSSNGGSGSGNEATTRTTTSSSRPDNFLIYSDNDTRMRELLGLEPPSNPNDGEEQEDWRQLVGFQGLGGRRHQRRNNDDRDADADAQAAPVNGNREAAAPRKTRISWELHTSAFDHLVTMQHDELGDGPLQLDEQHPRVERQQRGHGGENQNQNGQDQNNEE
eukprot:scaffold6619_cov146-Skeletonema_menzelii.AAC.8